ncbi:HK97 family phage prohead protease [Dysgonomonas sp. Marseille-P4677]|uniref:HK97 family phage prohead protease n=1 Tax=Dysgonomonas sp. Marseille-P4677 TaxID=2364790 RepID=UPI0019147CDA|nr:HK97 family phage prohead protease [Dysgonomonas sp. Marseille-P4677]MBK5719785.1 HK97 family phage prohead protease [Dysgonomonas sp. Marseille-P4677]
MDEKEQIFILSDSSQTNTKGFRVALSGGRFERFDSNPVMLYDHDTKLVIGRWEKRSIENGKMTATAVFDAGDPIAAEKARKVKEGFLRGASIGIIPLKMEEIGDEYVLTDWELIEASITPIPSDAGAVRLYNEKREVISFEQLKLSFSNNNKISKKMDEKDTIVLTGTTRQSLGLSANPTAKQIELAVQEKDDKIDELNKKVDKLEKAHVETYLSQAVKDGKITEKEKADYVKLSQGDNFDNVKSIIDAKQTEGSLSLKELADKGKTDLTAGDRSSWSWMDWAKKDNKGLQRLSHENPTEFERLKTEYKQSKNK